MRCQVKPVLSQAKLSELRREYEGSLEKLSCELGQIRKSMASLGYKNNNEIMSMSTLALPVSPALKLTDRGLLDVKTQKQVELIEV